MCQTISSSGHKMSKSDKCPERVLESERECEMRAKKIISVDKVSFVGLGVTIEYPQVKQAFRGEQTLGLGLDLYKPRLTRLREYLVR